MPSIGVYLGEGTYAELARHARQRDQTVPQVAAHILTVILSGENYEATRRRILG